MKRLNSKTIKLCIFLLTFSIICSACSDSSESAFNVERYEPDPDKYGNYSLIETNIPFDSFRKGLTKDEFFEITGFNSSGSSSTELVTGYYIPGVSLYGCTPNSDELSQVNFSKVTNTITSYNWTSHDFDSDKVDFDLVNQTFMDVFGKPISDEYEGYAEQNMYEWTYAHALIWELEEYTLRLDTVTENDKSTMQLWIEIQKPEQLPEDSTETDSGVFTNKFGTPTTKCAHAGCNNYIASSGDTNCCEKHSNKCVECGKYIDEDAMYCMDCLSKAANGI